MRVLVIGAAGFIGRHLTASLQKLNHEVVTCDPKDDAYCMEFSHFAKYHHEPFDVVYHLAVNSLPLDERLTCGMKAYQDIALDLDVCAWAEKHPPNKALILMETGAADARDTDPYAFVKSVLMRYAEVLHAKGVPVVVLKPFAGYGADQAETFPFRAILERALRHEDPLTVWGSLSTVRDWIHVSDIVRALVMAPDWPKMPEPVEIGTGVPTPFAVLARLMADAAGYSPQVSAVSDKPRSGSYRVADTAKALALGFMAEKSLEDAVREAVAQKAIGILALK